MVWTLALVGVLLKAFGGLRYPRLSLTLYLGMGWLGVVAVVPLVENLAPAGLAWLVGGGRGASLSRVPDHHPAATSRVKSAKERGAWPTISRVASRSSSVPAKPPS